MPQGGEQRRGEFAASVQPLLSRGGWESQSAGQGWSSSSGASPLPQSLVLINATAQNRASSQTLPCKGLAQTLCGADKHLRVTWGICIEEGTFPSCCCGFAQAECNHTESAQGPAQHSHRFILPVPFCPHSHSSDIQKSSARSKWKG